MRRIFLLLALSLQLLACGDGASSTPNIRPTADAGVDQSVDEQTLVILTGSGTDSDGASVSYRWSQTAGPRVRLDKANTRRASFTSPTLVAQTNLTFKLTITDDDGASATDSVVVSVNPVNAIPSADAGQDQKALGQTLVTLAGSGSDSDGKIVAYSWTQSSGVVVTLSDPKIASPILTLPNVVTEQQIAFDLMVTDNEGATATDQVIITIQGDTPPNADASITDTIRY